MATPIAHKGATAGAKALALTLVDLLTKPTIIAQAWDYFRTVQTQRHEVHAPSSARRTHRRSSSTRRSWRSSGRRCRSCYYDPSRYPTYLEQLGITYPTVRPCGPAT